MNVYEWLQAMLPLIVLLVATKPFGAFMARVYQGERTILTRVLLPFEDFLYRICRVDKDEEMEWKKYAGAVLIFSLVSFVALFAILMLQGFFPLNPQNFAGFSWHIAFNTAISFMTNTNWQAYSGESTASYFTQMAGLAVQNFASAATGMAIAIALIRGFVRRQTGSLGSFWVDLTRSILYILLPLSLVASIFLVSQGVIQNFSPYKKVTLVQPIVSEPISDSTGKTVTRKVNAVDLRKTVKIPSPVTI